MQKIIVIMVMAIMIMTTGCATQAIYNPPEEKPLITKTKIGEYTTKLGKSSSARINNINLALEKINGKTLDKGEEFSFNKIVGPRIKANGFKEAPIIINGKNAKGIGGGICQVSSTLNGAVQDAKLQVIERHKHSKPVGYCPPSVEATISEGVFDYRFKNNNQKDIEILCESTDELLRIEIWEITQ